MIKNVSLYGLFIHVILVALFVITIWQVRENQIRMSEEKKVVEKYGPTMQALCDDLGVDVQIERFEDLLNAFEQITTKTVQSGAAHPSVQGGGGASERLKRQ